MEIDWKYFAQTPGYISLKAAYIKNVQLASKHANPMRNKEEFLKQFNWVINRAKHYAHVQNTPIWEILDNWEDARDYWWLNFYQDCRQPKIHTNSLKPLGIHGIRKRGYDIYAFDSRLRKAYMRSYKQNIARSKRTKTKYRWSTLAKYHAKRQREARICKSIA